MVWGITPAVRIGPPFSSTCPLVGSDCRTPSWSPRRAWPRERPLQLRQRGRQFFSLFRFGRRRNSSRLAWRSARGVPLRASAASPSPVDGLAGNIRHRDIWRSGVGKGGVGQFERGFAGRGTGCEKHRDERGQDCTAFPPRKARPWFQAVSPTLCPRLYVFCTAVDLLVSNRSWSPDAETRPDKSVNDTPVSG